LATVKLQGIGEIEAKTGWDPRRELGLSLDGITQCAMEAGILVRPKEGKSIPELPGRWTGLDEEANAVLRSQPTKAPNSRSFVFLCGLGHERAGAPGGSSQAHRYSTDDMRLEHSKGTINQLP
jgi:hypothetical protein